MSQRCGPMLLRLRFLCLLGLMLTAGAIVSASPAYAWWNGDWSYRMKIVADAGPKGAAVTDAIGRTQILIRLHSGNFNFATAKDDGSDLRFVAGDDRTPLHFHIERFDGLVDQVGLVWVDVTDLAPGAATNLFVYWGNKNATNVSDSHATYDSDQVLVYHFADDNGLPHDATGYGNNALTPGKRDAAGLIGYGVRLDGKAPIHLPPSPSLALAAGQAATWSMWVKLDKDVSTAVLYTDRDGPAGFTIGIDQKVAYAQLDAPDGVKRTSAGPAITGEGWHHIAAEATADHLTIYVDGKAAGDVAATMPALAGQAVLGGSLPVTAAAAPPATTPPGSAPAVPAPATPPPDAAAAPGNLVGLLDEFEISKTARPLGALQLAVSAQGPDPKLLTFDVAEQSSLFGSGYIGIIMGSVTPDAWVVIGILMIMAVTSWWVMVTKAVYLNRLSGANTVFRTEYDRAMTAGGDNNRTAFSGISDTDRPKLRRSSLYRLYTVGSRELTLRLGGGTLEPSGVLAPQSIAAIRAAIDAGMVRETQKLNQLMVLLTIAISGGPFLGLLGTVVGVMITFAAIAQAGDVNVNAIAPGVSAALLATVAGLSVAIPALFAYNYFLIRIRDATADMTAFIDELVTRMGEGFRAPQPQEVFHMPAGDGPHTVISPELQAGE
jgi:biopolymer transport protein ExbB